MDLKAIQFQSSSSPVLYKLLRCEYFSTWNHHLRYVYFALASIIVRLDIHMQTHTRYWDDLCLFVINISASASELGN